MSVNPRPVACLLWLTSSLGAGASDLHRPVLYSVYGYDIVVRLMRIQAHPERDGPDGWIVVALSGRTPAYVRCRFADEMTLLCEAIVGRYPSEPAQTPEAADVEQGLRKAGYWRNADGTALFKYTITRDSGVWGAAAVTILSPLIDVFGARATSRIDIVAPLAPDRDEAAIRQEMQRQ